jgi:hypothetical protein
MKSIILLVIIMIGFNTKAQQWKAADLPSMEKVDVWTGSVADITEYKGGIYAVGYFKAGSADIKQGLVKLVNNKWELIYSFFNTENILGNSWFNLTIYKSTLVITGLNRMYLNGNRSFVVGFDGQSLIPFGTKSSGHIQDVLVFNDTLYVGGKFDTIGGQLVRNIAKWDGAIWKQVGGLNNDTLGEVFRIIENNNTLYATGFFPYNNSPSIYSDFAMYQSGKWSIPNNTTVSDFYVTMCNWNNKLVLSNTYFTYDIVHTYSQSNGLIPIGKERYYDVSNLFSIDNSLYLYDVRKGLSIYNVSDNIWDSILPPLGKDGQDSDIMNIRNVRGKWYVVGDFVTDNGAPSNFIAEFDPTPVGINETLLQNMSDIELFPNPTNNTLTINSTTEVTGYKILNLKGQNVKKETVKKTNYTIDVGGLPKGVYYMELEFTNGAHQVKKFVVY